MAQDITELAAFYEQPLGQRARRTILRTMKTFWPDLRGRRLLGYGYAVPYLRAFPETERAIAAMPAQLGVMSRDGSAVVLCAEDALPFPDVFFDRILIVHGLEAAESLRPLLRQLWRVLAPEGRILLVAANRASLWAQVERSPFGHGRPFSKGELDGLLRDALFYPGEWKRTLYAPPLKAIGSGAGWERIGGRFFPGIGGVHVVEAMKSLYAPASPGLKQPAKAPALKAASDLSFTPSSEER